MGIIKDKFQTNTIPKDNSLGTFTDIKEQGQSLLKSLKAGLQPVSQKKANLQTSEGLIQKARESGLEEEAKKITQQKGEDPKKIFSGGTVMDIFDTLNALQYGVTGIIKGKGFVEGMKTRQSFSDKDALGDFGLPGTIAGIALDIAVDPLTYAGGFGLLGKVSKGLKLGKAIKATGKGIGKIPVANKIGNKLGSMFIYRFGQSPIYKKIAERSIKNIAISNQNLLELARPLTKLDATAQKAIAEARKIGKLDELPKELLLKAKPAFDELDRLGKEAVEVGLLKAETYAENVGKYIARLYKKHELPEGIAGKIKTAFGVKPKRIDISRFKKRSDIPEHIREAMGEILEAGYPTAKSLVQLNSAIENAKFFKTVAGKWGKNVAEEGLEKLPETKRLGELSNKFVPKPIFDDIQEIIRSKGGALRKIVAGFKFGKVVMNPATHARNIMSNFILNNFEGLHPSRLDIYGKAAKQLLTKGDMYKEARSVGLGLDTFASREIKDMLIGPEAKGLKGIVKKTMDKISDMYQKEEEFAKLAQYIFQRGKGLTPDDAWKVSERATFDYSQVTPFIRKMRESIFGYPFITFTYKATPQVAKTIVTKPTKLSNLGKIKQAIENISSPEELKAERAVEPDYIKDGLYIRLPNKDKFGRNGYFDLTYIIPMGDIFTGQFIQREKEGETLPQTALRKLPFMSIISDLAQNKDFFGNDIVKKNSTEPQQQAGDIFRYLIKAYGPPIITDFPERIKRSIEFELTKEETPLEKEKRTTRTIGQELRRGLFGLKTTPFNIERETAKRERELRQKLQDLLIGEGILREFTIPFAPKD